jgi:hypothetical protein
MATCQIHHYMHLFQQYRLNSTNSKALYYVMSFTAHLFFTGTYVRAEVPEQL